MRTLYHLWLCPFSRKVRIVLGEKNLDFTLKQELPWKKRKEFLELNPAGLVPVLEEENSIIIADSNAICEYLDEFYDKGTLYGRDPYQRAEVRRLIAWFDSKFHSEVTCKLVLEKTIKRYLGNGWPDPKVIRKGIQNIKLHLDYMSWLLQNRYWLAGDDFSIVDIAAGAHISCVDYMGSIDWNKYPQIKEWYIKVKSRPSFRRLLEEKVPGLEPCVNYNRLDF